MSEAARREAAETGALHAMTVGSEDTVANRVAVEAANVRAGGANPVADDVANAADSDYVDVAAAAADIEAEAEVSEVGA